MSGWSDADRGLFGMKEGAHVPGYTGHIPAMRTHVHGQTYANMTVHAVSVPQGQGWWLDMLAPDLRTGSGIREVWAID